TQSPQHVESCGAPRSRCLASLCYDGSPCENQSHRARLQFLVPLPHREIPMRGPEINTSALIIVDMQNDFVHPEGGFAHLAREAPEAGIDMPFLMGTIPHVKRLADAFRTAGRPVVSIAHMVKPDYSDAQWPYWRLGLHPGAD